MIPKIIHYCWFGRKPLPDDVKKYIQTWKDKCPDYIIKEWNEDNFDVNKYKFTKEAYALKKYAFVSDVARVYALLNEGGIYLDTDVEVLKSFSDFLDQKTVLGYELDGEKIAIATAVIMSEPDQLWMSELLSYYSTISFIRWYGKLNTIPNPYIFYKILSNYGVIDFKNNHILLNNGVAIYPYDHFSAYNSQTDVLMATSNTYSIHHFHGSWILKGDSFVKKVKRLFKHICIKFSTNFS